MNSCPSNKNVGRSEPCCQMMQHKEQCGCCPTAGQKPRQTDPCRQASSQNNCSQNTRQMENCRPLTTQNSRMQNTRPVSTQNNCMQPARRMEPCRQGSSQSNCMQPSRRMEPCRQGSSQNNCMQNVCREEPCRQTMQCVTSPVGRQSECREESCTRKEETRRKSICEADLGCMSQEELYLYISQVSFVVSDMLLYLDTHPTDQCALAFCNEHIGMRNRALKEYARLYGPLTIDTADDASSESWEWVCTPWPWEGRLK